MDFVVSAVLQRAATAIFHCPLSKSQRWPAHISRWKVQMRTDGCIKGIHTCVYINVHRLTLAGSRFLFPLYFPSQGIDSQGVRAGRPVFNHFTPPLSQ
jgi:hypothetical protein